MWQIMQRMTTEIRTEQIWINVRPEIFQNFLMTILNIKSNQTTIKLPQQTHTPIHTGDLYKHLHFFWDIDQFQLITFFFFLNYLRYVQKAKDTIIHLIFIEKTLVLCNIFTKQLLYWESLHFFLKKIDFAICFLQILVYRQHTC